MGNFNGYSRGGIYLTKTKDFSQFQPVSPQILTGDQADIDKHIGTGSCVMKNNTYHFFYTGFNDGPRPSIATKATSDKLTVVIDTLPLQLMHLKDLKQVSLEIHTCIWDDTRNKYVMLVGSRSHGKSAIVRFQSSDLTEWEPIESIFSTNPENPKKFEIETDT